MRAFLDDTPLSCERETMRSAFDAAVAGAHESGRLIVDVLADGQPVPHDQLSEPSDEPTSSEFRFVTAEPATMVAKVLREASSATEQVAEAQAAAAASLHSGQMEEARAGLEQVVLIWQAIMQAVGRGSELVGRPIASEDLGDGRTLDAASQTLKGDLESLAASLSSQDWSALADTLEYDLAEHAKSWADLLTTAAERIDPIA